MTIPELAAILGESLKKEAVRAQTYATDPGPRIIWGEYDEDGNDITDRETLMMNIDGEIDLMELAKEVMALIPSLLD